MTNNKKGAQRPARDTARPSAPGRRPRRGWSPRPPPPRAAAGPGAGSAEPAPPHRAPSSRPTHVCQPPAPGLSARGPRAAVGCRRRCRRCCRRAPGTGLAIPVPVRPPRRYVKRGVSQCGSPARRTRQWLGAHLPGAHLPGSSPGSPPQRRLSRARPASSSTCLPRTAGAEVTSRFGRSTEGRGCSKRCRPGCRLYTAGCIRPVCVSGPSSAARSDYAVRLPFFLKLTPLSKTGHLG